MNSLQSQVAVVSGAGRGAGEAIAYRLAGMGAHVCLVARSIDELNRVREQIIRTGGAATAYPCDLTKAPAVAELGKALAEAHKRCDILVNNAAVGLDGKLLHEVTPDEWDLILDTNLRGPYLMIRALAPLMIAARSGHIINIPPSLDVTLSQKELSMRPRNGASMGLPTRWPKNCASTTFASALSLPDRSIQISAITPAGVQLQARTPRRSFSPMTSRPS